MVRLQEGYGGRAEYAAGRAGSAPPAPPVVVVVEKPAPAKPLVFEVKKVTGNAYLDFPVGKSAIQPDFRNNAAELAKIRGTLDSLIQAKNVRVRGITLVGYASPEGSTQLNDCLSAERADALKAYLLQNYKKGDPGLISARSGGEDWNGLRSLVGRFFDPRQRGSAEDTRFRCFGCGQEGEHQSAQRRSDLCDVAERLLPAPAQGRVHDRLRTGAAATEVAGTVERQL